MKKSIIFILLAAVLVAIVGFNSAYIVPENEHACITRFNKIDLSDEAREKIFWKNICGLLNVEM